ncbi:MAG: hypothetical protein RLZZ306_176 [Bacteroidota bacterium]|jgi:hypothetical protein
MKEYLGILLMIFSISSFAQERCGFSVGNKLKQLKNPNWIKQQAEFEYQLRELQNNQKDKNLKVTDQVFRIPVVVHVVHNNESNFVGGDPNSNISDEQIFSQIKVLNEDFRRKVGTKGFNNNPVGADMEFEFQLATKDPKGNPTNGITRTYYKYSGFNIQYDGELIANIIRWDYERYLNIWVVDTKFGTVGYSSFPYDSNLIGLGTTPIDLSTQEIFDGVIVDYKNFGTCCSTLSKDFNFGRTTTHEIGHWLGLLHPTEQDEPCSNDYCEDTPQIQKLNTTSTCNKMTSTCNGVLRTNMIENYMDYSPDVCMNIFTNDQKKRARTAIQLSLRRKKLLFNLEPIIEKENLTISIEPNPINSVSNIKVFFTGEKNVKINVFDLRGALIYEDYYEGQRSSIYGIKTDKLRTGTYILNVSTGDETSSQRIIVNR